MGDFSVAELSLGNLGKAQKTDAVTVSHDGCEAVHTRHSEGCSGPEIAS